MGRASYGFISMKIVTYDRNAQRVWICNQRIHHGACGCALIALAIRWRACLPIGLLLALHDWHDWKVWFKRELWNAIDPLT